MSAKAHRNEAATILQTPGELLANIPGILGFYPADSLILACMVDDEEDNNLTLGPIIRLDITDLRLMPDVARAIDSFQSPNIFAFLVSEKLDTHALDEIVDELLSAAEQNNLNIPGCWFTKEIISGEPYMLCFGPAPELLRQEDLGLSEWENGRISPITTAAATKKLLSEGHLPEVNRAEAYALFFRSNPFLDAAEVNQLQLEATDIAERIETKISMDSTGQFFSTTVEVFERSLGYVKGQFIGTQAGQENYDGLLKEAEVLQAAATYLCHNLLRDSVLHLCVDHPREATLLLRAVACTFDGEIRSNALCLYAVAAVSMGLGMKAIPALDASISTTPEHNLSLLLRQGLYDGEPTRLIDACLRGNQQLRDFHGPQ